MGIIIFVAPPARLIYLSGILIPDRYIYGTTTKRLNEQVFRNKDRFPEAFMFQLLPVEFSELKKQNFTDQWYNRRTLPFAFTEYGALMAANVLKSKVAVRMSIRIIETFVRLRGVTFNSNEISKRLRNLENKVGEHDDEIRIAFEVLKELMDPMSKKNKEQIGFI